MIDNGRYAMRFRSVAASVLLGCALCVAPAALGAGAQSLAIQPCPEVNDPPDYTISNGAKAWMKTNLRSDYLRGPGTITYNKTTTSSVNASITGTTSAEAGVIFAKASVSLAVSVGASYSKADSWSYAATVPAGKTLRLQQYKEGRSFTVQKYRIVPPCKVKYLWTKKAVAPVKSPSYLWQLIG
ncbi:hypothetical protein ACFQ05_00550 [Amycolatopsis umgeniensis]|uniref:Uncharacterized protein n=1 Tax=Amycolatopsis umgeniensis TaxID=336628 RepID=A0A841AXZ0_9PSEU|nr:hypothetical protein [Amycolatopsis umgeniensis]MBB5851743.1 hypothetical protein [Amycolatopsis umgeniensis]